MTIDLAAIGWDQRRITEYARFARPGWTAGRVLRTEAGVCSVLTAAGAVRASVAGSMLIDGGRDLAALPCAGDWVVLRSWPDRRVTIEAVLARTTVFSGGEPGRDAGEVSSRARAANVDAVAVLEPLTTGPDLGRIDRLLTTARRAGVEPRVLLTGGDQVSESALAEISDTVSAVSAGAPIHVLGRLSRDQLRSMVVPGRTLALLGAPGSGQSRVLAALAGTTVSSRWGKPRPLRTSSRRAGGPVLVALPFGGAVIDLPQLPGSVLADTSGLWRTKLS